MIWLWFIMIRWAKPVKSKGMQHVYGCVYLFTCWIKYNNITVLSIYRFQRVWAITSGLLDNAASFINLIGFFHGGTRQGIFNHIMGKPIVGWKCMPDNMRDNVCLINEFVMGHTRVAVWYKKNWTQNVMNRTRLCYSCADQIISAKETERNLMVKLCLFQWWLLIIGKKRMANDIFSTL